MDKELDFLIYNTPEEDAVINALVKDETIWLTQKVMAELFDCSTDNISLHLKTTFLTVNLIKIQLPRNSRQLLRMAGF